MYLDLFCFFLFLFFFYIFLWFWFLSDKKGKLSLVWGMESVYGLVMSGVFVLFEGMCWSGFFFCYGFFLLISSWGLKGCGLWSLGWGDFFLVFWVLFFLIFWSGVEFVGKCFWVSGVEFFVVIFCFWVVLVGCGKWDIDLVGVLCFFISCFVYELLLGVSGFMVWSDLE